MIKTHNEIPKVLNTSLPKKKSSKHKQAKAKLFFKQSQPCQIYKSLLPPCFIYVLPPFTTKLRRFEDIASADSDFQHRLMMNGFLAKSAVIAAILVLLLMGGFPVTSALIPFGNTTFSC